MADKQAKAQKVYKTMVKALKGKNWHFEEREQDLTIVSNYTGDDLPVKFIIRVDAEREVIQYLSPLPFKMEESKRVDAAVAVCVIGPLFFYNFEKAVEFAKTPIKYVVFGVNILLPPAAFILVMRKSARAKESV